MANIAFYPALTTLFGRHRDDGGDGIGSGWSEMLFLAGLGLLSAASAIGFPLSFADMFSLT